MFVLLLPGTVVLVWWFCVDTILFLSQNIKHLPSQSVTVSEMLSYFIKCIQSWASTCHHPHRILMWRSGTVNDSNSPLLSAWAHFNAGFLVLLPTLIKCHLISSSKKKCYTYTLLINWPIKSKRIIELFAYNNNNNTFFYLQ